MELFQLIAVGITGAIFIVTVKQHKPEIALALALVIGVLLLFMASGFLETILNTLRDMADQAGLSSGQWQLLIKLLVSGYVIEFGSEICKDAGQQALAAKLQMGGRLIMAGLALPVFKSLLTLITELLT